MPEPFNTSVADPPTVIAVPVTLTGTVTLLLPAVAVTVIVRSVGSPAALKVAVAAPVASVVAWVTARPPEVAAKPTVTPETNWFWALRTNAVMVALLLPSEGICGALVTTVIVCAAVPTVTVTLPDAVPEVAVTVMAVPDVADPAVRVAVAVPLALVVAEVTARPPALAPNATVTPETRLLFLSFAVAVMVALVLPSAAIVAVLDVTVMEATVDVVVVVVVLLVVVVIPRRASELPPHAASTRLHNIAVIDNTFRMLLLIPLNRCRAAPAISKDSTLHARFLA